MQFMIIGKPTKDSEAGVMSKEKLIAELAKYQNELVKIGARLDASRLQPSSKWWRTKDSGSKRTVIDGPFAETKEVMGGRSPIQAKSQKESIKWTKRFPHPAVDGKEGMIERLCEMGSGQRRSHGHP